MDNRPGDLAMNALEDTRELVETTSAPTAIGDVRTNRSRFVAGFVDDLLYKYPDVELATIRITELDGVIHVTGRRGPLAPAECPSCHTTDGHPHTDYCQTKAAGHACYVERPDGTTAAATQCIDPDCRYPNPHTHPHLIAEP